jgi:uncharacterized protein (TIGR01777 family)
MQILITGGTGFIGSELVKHLIPHHMTILTRDIKQAQQKLKHINSSNLSYLNSLDELSSLDQFDAVINLAGEPIADKRWNDAQKTRICDSRWKLTEQIAQLSNISQDPPSVLINGSAVGYYGDHGQKIIDEATLPQGDDFPQLVCQKWERLALQASSANTRVCLLRTGVVLDKGKGALAKMELPYRLGLGGPIGAGEQYMPWIHHLDVVRAISFLLKNNKMHGPFNIVAPHPVANKVFSKTLAKTLKRPHFLFTPKLMMKIIMGESSCLLFDSLNVKPSKLTEAGFHFTYSHLQPALQQIYHR